VTGPTADTFAAVFAALYAAHEVGDLWVQRHSEALAKGGPGWHGRLMCARHVASLTATKAVFVAAMAAVTSVAVGLGWLALGLAADAAAHYWADRRSTLAWLAGRLGKGEFFRLGAPRPGRDDVPHLGTGAYALDQSFHIGCLFVAALVITAGVS
jgi:hypothetical protein